MIRQGIVTQNQRGQAQDPAGACSPPVRGLPIAINIQGIDRVGAGQSKISKADDALAKG